MLTSGRLVWNLPGGTSMTCHLKDKKKIRVKKMVEQEFCFRH